MAKPAQALELMMMTAAAVRGWNLRLFLAMLAAVLAASSCASSNALRVLHPVPNVPPRVPRPSAAITATSPVTKLQVLSHHFASSVSDGSGTVSIKNENEARVLVLKVAIEVSRAEELSGTDFVLAYTSPDGEEDRSLCRGIGLASSRAPGEFDKWDVGRYPEIQLPNAGKSIIGLAFVIEAGVSELTVTRLGSDIGARYVIGLERRRSVAVFADGPGQALEDIRSLLAGNGYDVSVRATLADSVRAPTVHHTKISETLARDVAARLSNTFGIVPKVEKSELASVHDLVVWLPGIAQVQSRQQVAPVARPLFQPSSEMRLVDPVSGLQILSHHFTTGINTGTKLASVDEPSESRFLVVKVRAYRNVAHAELQCADFRLSYRHSNGDPDWSQCRGVALSPSSKPGDFDDWGLGSYPSLDSKGAASGAHFQFGMAFVLENDVESVTLLRAGTVSGARYPLGADHPFSVYVSTNEPTLDIDQVRSAVAAGGFDVLTSTDLDDSVHDYSVQYQDDAEAAARDVSNRLADVLGVFPTMKKSKLVTEFDIVVWIPRR